MIKIVCVGKIKELFYRDAIEEYMKRLGKYHKVVIEEVMDSNVRDEGIALLKRIGKKDYVVTLEVAGKSLDSLEFANFIDKTFLNYSTITFVIGGSNGLAEEVKKAANFKLSFSDLTFPHQLFRVILLEQIYRAFKILHHESYHK